MSYGSCYTPDFHAFSIIGASAGTSAANDRRLVESSAGTPTFVADAIDTGRYALRSASASGQSISLSPVAATPRYSGMLFRWQADSFTANVQFCQLAASTATENVRLRVSSAGLLAYSFNQGSTYSNTTYTFTAGQVYRVEVFVDWGVSTSHTLKIRINGAEILNQNGGAASVTGLTATFGALTSTGTSLLDYADMVTYNDTAQYAAMDDWRVYGLEPVADGTHSFTDNDFKNAAGTAITAANVAAMTTWDMVNDAPGAAPTVTDFVQQAVVAGSSYMEWQLRTNGVPTSAGAPVLVCLAAAMHPVGATTANACQFRLNSGGNLSTETAVDTSIASNTLEYRKHHYLTEPSTAAAWTVSKANALRARFGYDGTSIAAPPALDSIMGFVVCPRSGGGQALMIGQVI